MLALRRASRRSPGPEVYSLPMQRSTLAAQGLAYYQASFREAVREDGVVCLECGALRRNQAPEVPRKIAWKR